MTADPTAPQLAVVVPTHNRRDLLQETVESILAERAVPIELIVVDDGSIDETAEYLASVRDERLTVLRNEPARERSAARNRGLAEVRAPFVLFLDDDDLIAPGGLAHFARGAASAPGDAVGVIGRLAWFSAGHPAVPERWVRSEHVADLLGDCVLDPFLGPNRALLRTQTVRELGGWSEAHPPFEDYLLALLLAARGPAVVLADLVVHRRGHEGQSDLSDSRARRAAIRELVIGSVDADRGALIARRARALDLVFAAHELPRSARAARLRAAARALRSDPSALTSPVARLTVGHMLARLVAGALRPRRATR